jgi:2-hydroxychromene-2-carboxylate isomerase
LTRAPSVRRRDDTDPKCACCGGKPADADRILALAAAQVVKDALLVDTRHSIERGTFGSPTFVVGDEIHFGKDRLRDVEEVPASMSHRGE